MIKLDFKMDPSPDVLAKSFRSLRSEMRDWRDAWRDLLPVVSQDQKASFGALAGMWPALKQASIRRKGGGRETLVMTGRLRRSLGKKLSLRKMSLRVGTSLKYAAPHQFGSRKQGIPARPFIALDEKMQGKIKASLRTELAKKIARALRNA